MVSTAVGSSSLGSCVQFSSPVMDGSGTGADRTVTYCGGGIAASADAFVMTRLGFTDVAVYTASLQEWAADETNPLTV